jgi:hypothetical protein
VFETYQRAATHHIRTLEGTTGTGQELKTSNIQIGESSPETSTHLSYRSISKVISCQKTPKAALVAAQTYLFTTQPGPGDPREHMHRAALQGLRLVGNKLTAKEEEAYRKGTHKPQSPHRHSSPRQRSSSRRSRSSSPKYYKSPRHGGTWRSRTPTKAYEYEDDEKEMGAPCFTRRVRTTPVPKGFKLFHDQQKYDGSQEPQSWLSDYLQAVRILGGSKETAMQSL